MSMRRRAIPLHADHGEPSDGTIEDPTTMLTSPDGSSVDAPPSVDEPPSDGPPPPPPDPLALASDPPPPPPDASIVHVADPHAGDGADRRSFEAAVQRLRTGGGTLNLSERTLMVIGGVVAPLGLLVVLLGWLGAARTPNLFEQIPYVISGGMFGLALVFLGGFFYFAHWITELVKEHRSSSAALLEAIGRLQESIETTARTEDPGSRVAENGHVDLVATDRGSMAHRTDCAVVIGKSDLRTVSPADGLAPCKLCEPYADMS